MDQSSFSSASFWVSDQEKEYCQQRGIPLPTKAPYERLRELLGFYNSIFLYNSTCALTGKAMLSIVPPTKNFKVYDISVWMDDTTWDPLSYGRDYDFSRPFFEQFEELMREVPIPSRSVVLSTMENSDYTNGISNAKNCYLIFDSNMSEDCYFCYQMNNVKNVIDSIDINDCELCYGCQHLKNCYNVRFADSCEHASDSTFIFNCRSVQNCFGCTNLTNKQYCFFNQQLTKEDYEARVAAIDLRSAQVLQAEKAKFEEFKKQAFIKDLAGQSNENCTGNFLYECRNCDHTFFSTQAEDCEYSIRATRGKNCFVYAIFGINVELIYNSVVCGNNVYNLQFCYGCFVNVRDLEYCMHVGHGASDCFASIGIRKKQYCVLNKQYSKEAYFELVAKIKDHMRQTGEYGQFFPKHFSSFYYNKSEAINFFPLTKAEALAQGYSWEDDVVEPFETTFTIPDSIADVTDTITSEVLKCELTGKKYRVIKQELDLYRRWQVPIPRIAPLERLKLSCQVLNLPVLQDSNCANCTKKIVTGYSEQSPRVFCEDCYQKSMV